MAFGHTKFQAKIHKVELGWAWLLIDLDADYVFNYGGPSEAIQFQLIRIDS